MRYTIKCEGDNGAGFMEPGGMGFFGCMEVEASTAQEAIDKARTLLQREGYPVDVNLRLVTGKGRDADGDGRVWV